MMDDDDQVRSRPATRLDLETMSMQALNDYIDELEAEIARVRATLAAKRQARDGAEALFRL